MSFLYWMEVPTHLSPPIADTDQKTNSALLVSACPPDKIKAFHEIVDDINKNLSKATERGLQPAK